MAQSGSNRKMIIRVLRKNGEKVRRLLSGRGLLGEYQLESDGEYVYLGTSRALSNGELDEFDAKKSGRRLKKKEALPKNLEAILKKELSENELEKLPGSYDVMGRIIVVMIPDELVQKERLIAKALLKVNKSVETVAKRIGEVTGEFRTRDLKILAGPDNTEAECVEYGCRYQFDIRKVFFTPRLATERKRVADMVGKDETVLDMFAGVGPFAILIAKKAGAKVYALDINPDAVESLKRNIRLNKVEGRVIPILGDAHKASELVPKVDRVVMNLAKTGFGFLPDALKCVESGVIHYHFFAMEDGIEEKLKEIEQTVLDAGKKFEIIGWRKVRQVSPREWNCGIDFRVG